MVSFIGTFARVLSPTDYRGIYFLFIIRQGLGIARGGNEEKL